MSSKQSQISLMCNGNVNNERNVADNMSIEMKSDYERSKK